MSFLNKYTRHEVTKFVSNLLVVYSPARERLEFRVDINFSLLHCCIHEQNPKPERHPMVKLNSFFQILFIVF
jgi:hypothetical protein